MRLRTGTAVIPQPDGSIQLRAGDERVHVLHVDDQKAALCILRGEPHPDTELRDELRRALAEDWLATDEARGPDYLVQFGFRGTLGVGIASAELATLSGLPEGDDVLISVTDAPDYKAHARINERAVRERKPCLFIDLSHGQHATVGPFYVPGEGACYECFRIRLRENTESYAELTAAEAHMLEHGPLPGAGLLPAHRAWVLGLAATELLAFASRHRPLRTLNRVVTVAFEELRSFTEPAWRVPTCAVCK